MQQYKYRTLKTASRLFTISGDDPRKSYEKRNMVSPWCFEANQYSLALDMAENPPLLFDIAHETKLRVTQRIDCKATKLGCFSSHFQRLLLLS